MTRLLRAALYLGLVLAAHTGMFPRPLREVWGERRGGSTMVKHLSTFPDSRLEVVAAEA